MSLLHFKKHTGGFTLIELLVVIGIIGVLASIVLASLNTARLKSRDAKRIAEVNQLTKALDLYFNEVQVYPDTLNELTTGCGSACIPSIPADPLSGSYLYCKISDTSYHLAANLETQGHSALDTDSDLVTNPCPTAGGDTIVGTPDTTACDGVATDRACYDTLK